MNELPTEILYIIIKFANQDHVYPEQREVNSRFYYLMGRIFDYWTDIYALQFKEDMHMNLYKDNLRIHLKVVSKTLRQIKSKYLRWELLKYIYDLREYDYYRFSCKIEGKSMKELVDKLGYVEK